MARSIYKIFFAVLLVGVAFLKEKGAAAPIDPTPTDIAVPNFVHIRPPIFTDVPYPSYTAARLRRRQEPVIEPTETVEPGPYPAKPTGACRYFFDTGMVCDDPNDPEPSPIVEPTKVVEPGPYPAKPTGELVCSGPGSDICYDPNDPEPSPVIEPTKVVEPGPYPAKPTDELVCSGPGSDICYDPNDPEPSPGAHRLRRQVPVIEPTQVVEPEPYPTETTDEPEPYPTEPTDEPEPYPAEPTDEPEARRRRRQVPVIEPTKTVEPEPHPTELTDEPEPTEDATEPEPSPEARRGRGHRHAM
ncbi:hypothetical protein EC968_002044 [Mortierella alpina]|nr:hypothetical protein EC968_002044 [Mortierella alpina]